MTTQIRKNEAKAGTENVDLVDPVSATGASESVQHDDREAVRFAEVLVKHLNVADGNERHQFAFLEGTDHFMLTFLTHRSAFDVTECRKPVDLRAKAHPPSPEDQTLKYAEGDNTVGRTATAPSWLEQGND
jgi:hypothetical protein